MKKFTGLVVFLAALVLGSYYGMGYLTEKKVKEDLKLVNQSEGINVEVVNYNRGWFTSEALLNWHLQIPEHEIKTPDGQPKIVAAEDYQLNMPLTIYHGPVIIANKTVKFGLGYAHTDLVLPPKFADQFKNTFTPESTQPKLELSLLVSYLNNSNIDFSVPDFKLVSKNINGGKLDWMGMTSATNVSSDRSKISGNLTVEGLRFVKDKTQTLMSNVTSEYNLHKSPTGIYLGDASLSFPSLSVTMGDQKLLELSQFDVHSDTNIEEGLFHSQLKSSVEKIIVNNKTYGPGVVAIGIRNLDADVLAKINDQVNQMQQGNEQQSQQAVLAILPQLPQLLSRGAEFEVSELSFAMPEGKIEGNLLVSLPKDKAANPFELIQKIQGNGKLKIPTLVLRNILTQSYKQKLSAPQQTQPQNIQQGIVQQMQQQTGQEATTNQTTATIAPTDSTTVNPAPVDPSTVKPAADVMAQAAEMADKQLASMVQSGVLILQGNDYLIEMNFNQGKLMVNGKPFDPAMLKMQ
ncbi:MAG: YdgA family protein [Tatlockia sp.]|nr:YdgA family protein [Tatlockia sp.]